MTENERNPTGEILQLLDKLEALVSGAARVPLTSRSLIDEQDFIDILDQIRASVPEEVRQAKRLSQERERVIVQAQAEADRIVVQARDEARMLVDESELIRLAQERARAIVGEAETRADEVSRGADQYALAVLDGLEEQLTRYLATVRKGKIALERSLQTGEAPGPPQSDEVEALHRS